jgi:DNA-binding transcriptional ArsR family regulator
MVMDATQATFRAISDPTRRAILDLLAGRDLAVKEIVAEFPVSQPAVSKHLRILREAGLVRERQQGRLRLYRLAPEPFGDVEEWISMHRTAARPGVPTLRAWVDARSAGETAARAAGRETGGEESMASVQCTRHLRLHFPDLEDVEVPGESLAQVVRALDGLHPGLADYLLDERGALRKHVNIFVNDGLLRDRRSLSDRVAPGDRVFIMQALSGG